MKKKNIVVRYQADFHYGIETMTTPRDVDLLWIQDRKLTNRTRHGVKEAGKEI